MRLTGRALETRSVGVDPPPRPRAASMTRRRATAGALKRGRMLRRSYWTSQATARGAFVAIVWRGKSLPHARQDRQASLIADLWRASRDQKSPVRRCFKSRPPFGGVRRFASGCRFFRRWLTGLLSRSPPTDTRPQARAYWASEVLGQTPRFTSIIFVSGELFSLCRNFVMCLSPGIDFPLIFWARGTSKPRVGPGLAEMVRGSQPASPDAIIGCIAGWKVL